MRKCKHHIHANPMWWGPIDICGEKEDDVYGYPIECEGEDLMCEYFDELEPWWRRLCMYLFMVR